MGTFTSVFGGNNIAPALPTYLALSIAVNTTLGWPTELTAAGQPVVAEILDVTATAASLIIGLSDARRVSTGYCALFNNVGSNTFTIQDNLGNTLMTVPSGQVWQIYLADNTTQQGTWRVFQYGAGVSNANAASLAGAGLKAISTTLNENITINQQSTNYTIQNNDRAACVEWTGGSGGVFTSPNPAAVGSGWFCFIQNSGTGTLTFTPSSGTINGASSQVFQPFDSAIIVTDGTNFITIGLGRAVASSFNFVQISLAGLSGNYTLTGANLNRVSYRFTGAITGNVVVIVPGSIQQYWVDNETTGAFSLSFMASGASVTIAQGNKAILYCDGTNVVNAVTIPSVSAGGTNTQVQYNNSGSFGGSSMTFQSGTGAFTIAAPASGIALTVNGIAGGTAMATTGVVAINGAGALDLGLQITISSVDSLWLGTNNSGSTNAIGAATGTDYLFTNQGRPLVLGTAGVPRLSIGSSGNVTVSAPASGYALTVTGIIQSVNGISAGGTSIIGTNPAPLQFIGTTNGSPFATYDGFNVGWNGSNWVTGTDGGSNGGVLMRMNYGTAALAIIPLANTGGTNQVIANGSLPTLGLTLSAVGNFAVLAPTSGTALTVSDSSNTVGSGGGVDVFSQNGTINSVYGWDHIATSFSTYSLQIGGHAALTLTGSALSGWGPTAAASVDMTPDTNFFTGTLTGMTTTVSGTCFWERHGRHVMLFIPAMLGTSNANTLTLTGLPAAIQTSRSLTVQVPDWSMENGSTVVTNTAALFTAATGTITFLGTSGSGSGWNATGTKGVTSAIVITYWIG